MHRYYQCLRGRGCLCQPQPRRFLWDAGAEAMACALPVIMSAFAGVSSLLHDGTDGFVLQDPRDADTLAKLVRILFDQRELRSRVGEAAAKTALEWTWDRNAAKVWDLLKEVNFKKHSSRVLQGESSSS